MAIPLYLAMTAAETAGNPLPEKMAYMACHFASYGLGISNIPAALPTDAMLILNDLIPIWEHDPVLVARQLADAAAELRCSCVLLDFQRKDEPRAAAVARSVLDALPCPVGISEYYANGLECPVFLSAPAPDVPLERYLTPWKGRELWLEAALESLQITVSTTGSTPKPIPYAEPALPCHKDQRLCCSYHMELLEDRAIFTISRTKEDLFLLLEEAAAMGVTRAVGLYQQLA